jgi:peptide/nickel transport system substrate-binding protein
MTKRTSLLRIAQARLPLRDPHDCTDGSDELALYEAFFDPLVRRKGKSFVSCLAEHWHVSDDATRWSFTIRPGVLFHDGSPCNADAVVASLQRMARLDKGYTLGAPGVWHQYLGKAEIVAKDELTVELQLAEPIADLLDILVQGYIVSPASFPRMDAGDTSHPVGTGRFRFVSGTPEILSATRNDAYFLAPALNERIEVVAVPAPADRLAALFSGTVDAATALEYEPSQVLPKDRFTRVETLAPVAIIYLLNAAKGPLANRLVREALSLVIDRDELIEKAVFGAARPLHGFVSPNHFGAGQSPAPARNLEKARKLLAEAGFGGGLTLGLDCPTRLPDEAQRLTAALSQQLQEVGVTLDIHLHEDREAYAHMVRRKEIRDLCVFDSSPMSTFRVLYEKLDARVRGSWWQGYHNEKVERLIDAARSTVDAEARARIYAEAYAEVQTDPAWLTLYNPMKITGLRGIHPGFALASDAVMDFASLPERDAPDA